MSTLDEITNEKQRVSEALAGVEAQREKLADQLANWRQPSVCWRVTAKALRQERRAQPGRR